jgi:hypothetical protein
MLAGLILLLGGIAFLDGCETLERTIKDHPKSAVPPEAGRSAESVGGSAASGGTVVSVGGLTGVLSGGVIGDLVDRQERMRAATAASIAYSEEKGHVVRIEEASLTPQALRPGEAIDISMQYAIVTQRGTEPVRVREIRHIYYRGELVGNPVMQIERANGTYWSMLPITLPQTAAPGRYEVVMGVEVFGTLDRWESSFTLLQP